MTRSELIKTLTAQYRSLTTKDVEESVNTLLDGIMDVLSHNGRVELRGFGVFSVTHRKPRIGRNPSNGDRVSVPAKSMVRFKPGNELKKRVLRA